MASLLFFGCRGAACRGAAVGHDLWFNNDEVRDVDLADSLKGEAFLPLFDKEYFKRFSIRFNTIEWDNGTDFAPEYLYDLGAIA